MESAKNQNCDGENLKQIPSNRNKLLKELVKLVNVDLDTIIIEYFSEFVVALPIKQYYFGQDEKHKFLRLVE